MIFYRRNILLLNRMQLSLNATELLLQKGRKKKGNKSHRLAFVKTTPRTKASERIRCPRAKLMRPWGGICGGRRVLYFDREIFITIFWPCSRERAATKRGIAAVHRESNSGQLMQNRLCAALDDYPLATNRWDRSARVNAPSTRINDTIRLNRLFAARNVVINMQFIPMENRLFINLLEKIY